MATTTTAPATIELWDDVQHALSGGGDGRSCQCIWPILRNKDWQETTLDERRDMLRADISTGPPPGLVAYVDGTAAGWIRVGPRTVQQRILHTRAIAAATDEPLDDSSVWSVTCFVIRREHRGRGLSATMLASAVDYARSHGARVLEAYPVDTSTGSHRSNDLFHGTLATFLAAGFTRGPAIRTTRVLVTRVLRTEAARTAGTTVAT
ncbi:GNAT family N-acetyltransferase [Microbacterium sp. USHLN186]|uniref:GNAT family N-acetyltransferase n=1 Tax=Microbacterium sp. USHLN186 TaxID=3081286 RepID=UPI003018B683